MTTHSDGDLLKLAEQIEASEGLIRIVPGQGTVQLGIKATAQVIAALRHSVSASAAGRGEVVAVHDYVANYEFRDPDYSPTDRERAMIEDAIEGYLAITPPAAETAGIGKRCAECNCNNGECNWIAAAPSDTAGVNEIANVLRAIIVRCDEGDKKSDWLPIISNLAKSVLPKAAALATPADTSASVVNALRLCKQFIDPDLDPPRMTNRELVAKIDTVLTSRGKADR
jgi:hypothetical protein